MVFVKPLCLFRLSKRFEVPVTVSIFRVFNINKQKSDGQRYYDIHFYILYESS